MKKIILAAVIFFLISVEIGLPGTGSAAALNALSSVTLPIMATSSDMSKGVPGYLRITMLDDKDMLVFADNIIIDEKTYLAALHAIEFAETYTGKDAGFLIEYILPAQAASGGSTGSAIAAGSIALLSGKKIIERTLITGEIDSSGNLIKTGAVPIKAMAAGAYAFNMMIIPEGQSKFLVYERHIQPGVSDSSHIIVKEYDLVKIMKERYDMEIIEIANIKDALPYLLA